MPNRISGIIDEVRARFAHVETCPLSGERVFFENAGGALHLKSAVETSAFYASIPDNQGRDNVASKKLVQVIDQARQDAACFLNAPTGQIVVGESGTELLFRFIRAACLGVGGQGCVIGSTVEHPASRSAAIRWAQIAGLSYVSVPHDNETGQVTPQAYGAALRPDTKVATILHTSPLTGMGMDIAGISRAIRAVAPTCIIIVDGIQHAAHGGIDISQYQVDGYVVSPYKVYARHGYGLGWLSDRLQGVERDVLLGAPGCGWELGTRDTGSYATFTDVVDYFDWLGEQVSVATDRHDRHDRRDRRDRIVQAGQAIKAYEKHLTDAAIYGTGNLPGLSEYENLEILGRADNLDREGLVSFYVKDVASADIVAMLNENGIRTHVRKADHYSGGILTPLGLADCVRVSFCHYNTLEEVARFLAVMKDYQERLAV